ncbi:Hypothetical predicted protein [Marmota monax]|uniref:Uncharacterized protein n=1 Tax=Marmota monax TaxID=9995 RepID=A0A5E4D565_MARMO|nr:hypothetical protein GHT09_017126 [Marmota monax]VTJ88382.1 Hypothetical predicted protein [Marmota monax]
MNASHGRVPWRLLRVGVTPGATLAPAQAAFPTPIFRLPFFAATVYPLLFICPQTAWTPEKEIP